MSGGDRDEMTGVGAVHAVIAVKGLGGAKSRLAEEFARADRAALVLAMLDDTLRTVGDTPEIGSFTVVTPDSTVAAAAAGRGARIAPEPPSGRHDSLNAALRAVFEMLRHDHGPAANLMALQADLPAARTVELGAALQAAPIGRAAVVADHVGTGTSALVVPAGLVPEPRFGRDSARLHVEAGAVALSGEWPGLRLDVDTAADLRRALTLGVGPATGKFLAEIGWVPRAS